MGKQSDIAKELGISKSYLSMILSGQRKIPRHLKKPISELIYNNTVSGSAFQAGCRGFESRLPLQLQKDDFLGPISLDSAPRQVVAISVTLSPQLQRLDTLPPNQGVANTVPQCYGQSAGTN